MGTFGDPLGTFGGHWGPMGAYAGLWGPIGTLGDLSAPLGAYGGLWGPMGTFFFCHFPCSQIFPIFPFWCSKSFLLLYCHVSDCPRWFPNDFSIVSSLFVFFIWGGG